VLKEIAVHYLRRAALKASKRATLRKYQNNQCCWCGKPMQFERPEKWDYETIEHLTPKSKGGTNAITNLALAHRRCNAERGTKDKEPLLRRVAQ
jgi:5-methylcytosine-specific restriction endonuclease McrA